MGGYIAIELAKLLSWGVAFVLCIAVIRWSKIRKKHSEVADWQKRRIIYSLLSWFVYIFGSYVFFENFDLLGLLGNMMPWYAYLYATMGIIIALFGIGMMVKMMMDSFKPVRIIEKIL